MTNDIREFCKKFNACKSGRDWALANCADMADAWQKAKPEWLVWIATRDGVLDDRGLRLFACWTVRQVWELLTDERSRNAVEVAERFANGQATVEELAAADAAACAAAYAAAYAAYAAYAAARAAAYAMADAAAYAAYAAARAAAYAMADAAAYAAYAAWLRAAYPNPFVARTPTA